MFEGFQLCYPFLTMEPIIVAFVHRGGVTLNHIPPSIVGLLDQNGKFRVLNAKMANGVLAS